MTDLEGTLKGLGRGQVGLYRAVWGEGSWGLKWLGLQGIACG